MPNVTSLVGYLLMLRSEQRTGVLSLKCGELESTLYLRTGQLVFAEENAHVETFGRLLIRQDLLTQAQYDAVIAKMSEARSLEEQLRFGDLCVELRLLSTAQVAKALADQVRRRVMRIFQRVDEVSWQFQPRAEAEIVFAPSTPGAALGGEPFSVEELLLDAVRWIDDDLKNELGLFAALGQRVGVRPEDRAEVIRRFALGREDAEFLSKVDGKRSLGEVLSLSGSVDGPAIVTALVMTNTLGRTDGPGPAARSAPAPTPAPIAPNPPPAPAARVTPAAPITPSFAARTPHQPIAVARPPAVTPTPPAPLASAGSSRPAEDEEPAPQSIRSPWWGGAKPPAPPAKTTPAPGAKTPTPPARTTPAPGAKTPTPPPTSTSMRSAPPAQVATRTPAPPASQGRIPIPPPPKPSTSGMAAVSRIPTVTPGATRVPTTPPASAGRIQAASPSNPVPSTPASNRPGTRPSSSGMSAVSGSASRIPAAPPSNPAPQSGRASAVMQALEAQRRPGGSNDRIPAATSHEAKLTAEKEFQRALGHFKSFHYADAAPGFARAVDLFPQSDEYRLYARWCTILAKGGPMQVHDRGEAWRLALAAIAADPNSAFAHYVAGAVAQEDGQKPIAARYLSRAVKLDPQLLDAQRRLRIVERAD